MEIVREAVRSSCVVSIGYDDSSHILEVESSRNRVWRYYDVPRKTYEDFISAESKGKFYLKYVRGKFLREQIA